MTRLRRNPMQRRAEFYSDAWTKLLVTGSRIVRLIELCDPDEHTIRLGWQTRRDDLLSAAAPGTRPWAWWEFERPEDRRKVSGGGTEDWRPGAGVFTEAPAGANRLWLAHDDDPPIWESEREYLERLGLLTESEQRRLSELRTK